MATKKNENKKSLKFEFYLLSFVLLNVYLYRFCERGLKINIF